MLASNIPANKFPVAWASSAGGGYVRTIPQASQIGIQDGAASLTDGFPPLTFLPVASGGVPPFGEDANGILKEITLWSQWQQAGGQVPYDGSFSTSIGGYPKGATLASTKYTGLLWRSTADSNGTDPDSSSAANWAVARRATLSADTTFNVATTGSDVNGNGTVGTPWLTLGKAITVLQQYFDLSGFTATVQLADGSYTGDGAVLLAPMVGGKSVASLVIQGNAGTPANVIVTSASNTPAFWAAVGGAMTVKNLKAVGGSGTTNLLLAQNGGIITMAGGLVLGAATGHFFALSGSTININGAYTIAGNIANYHLQASDGGLITHSGSFTVTLSGTPTFTAFAEADSCGVISDSATTTYSGSGTGQRYNASLNGVINTSGGGATFFPGNVGGATATGGQYA